MAYDEQLAARVRELVPPGTAETRMFGGLAFMVNTHMALSLSGDGLLVRVDDPEAAAARGAEEMRMGERVMTGFMRVPAAALATDDALAGWVGPAVAEAQATPPKVRKTPKTPRRPKGSDKNG
ncbi:TfoX N-terminal domain-containing protein [Nocardioides terrae]|uniref:TfoX N-terminal domain-containing protein n=1 Tax=Nocardioides terrae TaxID=574651 RepID=A0A1I1DH36_9ACTN|nr:TfoX/Sxy family protein [Nocardioides terrae]SFB74279.1 TfoX N-terminal domain-containing protein [Nocardioides terrae]